jgi:cob(I)alamin adenosyltransferase
MAEERYRAPRVAITRVYTKKGDAGETGLVGGQRVRKDDPRIVAYGTVDELNAFVGAARQTLGEHAAQTPALAALGEVLLRVQHELFNLGSVLATRPEDLRPQQARIGAHDITALEADMDQRNEELAALRSFVLPGGCRANTDLHVARTVCRRAERACVALAAVEAVDPQAIAYLNRLSDAFFVWSRWVSAKLGCEETLWDPNVAASAKDSPPAPSRDR